MVKAWEATKVEWAADAKGWVSLQDRGEVIRFLGNQTVQALFIVKAWEAMLRWVRSECRRVVRLQDPREMVRFLENQTVETLFMGKAWQALWSLVRIGYKMVVSLQDPEEVIRFLGNYSNGRSPVYCQGLRSNVKVSEEQMQKGVKLTKSKRDWWWFKR